MQCRYYDWTIKEIAGKREGRERRIYTNLWIQIIYFLDGIFHMTTLDCLSHSHAISDGVQVYICCSSLRNQNDVMLQIFRLWWIKRDPANCMVTALKAYYPGTHKDFNMIVKLGKDQITIRQHCHISCWNFLLSSLCLWALCIVENSTNTASAGLILYMQSVMINSMVRFTLHRIRWVPDSSWNFSAAST